MASTTPRPDEPMLAELLVGFEALARKVDELVAKNNALEKQLKAHTQQTLENSTLEASRRSSDHVQSTAPTSVSEWRDNDCFAPGIEAWKKLKEMRGRNIDAEKLERDFTTPGRVGDLRCPFAQRTARKLSRGTTSSPLRSNVVPSPPCVKEEGCMQNPEALGVHTNTVRSPPASVQNSTVKCPIRYLDDRSPEEVAKYFENHKHEIPRSHEVCVKRYQSDEESIKQLDAKYGNLVNMIQGLGVKHQPMLPAEDAEPEQKSMNKVEQWAEKCVENPPAPGEELDEVKSEDRTGHFERPLQEVRLGESPSRPWGIQVPLERQTAASAEGSVDSNAAQSIAAAVEHQAESEAQEPVKRCPFSQFATRPTAGFEEVKAPKHNGPIIKEAPAIVSKAQMEEKESKPTGIVFNGPVFFGYQAVDIEAILRGLQKSS